MTSDITADSDVTSEKALSAASVLNSLVVAYADANTLLREMKDKKFKVRFDPTNPSRFYVAEDTNEGREVKFRAGASLTA